MPLNRDRSTIGLLSSVDWSFDTPLYSRSRNPFLFDCRKHHWYPATFVPEIPYTLIEVLSEPGEIVYDPFSGIGTTVLQSLMLGRVPYGVERCEVAVEFIRAVWTLLHPTTDLDDVRQRLGDTLAMYDEGYRYSSDLGRADTVCVERLEPWFHPVTFNEIAFLILRYRGEEAGPARSALWIALSATLKAVCAQDRGWGCIADNVRPKGDQLSKYREAVRRLQRNYTLLVRSIEETRQGMDRAALEFIGGSDATEHIVHGDARTEKISESAGIDLVVSSPPYPNMTDYATSQRLSYYLLGMSPDEDFRSEIGARRRRTRRDAIDAYRRGMGEALGLVAEQVRLGGHACFVMPTFTRDGVGYERRHQVVEECMAVLVEKELSKVGELERILPRRRRHHNQRWTSLERETIHIFRRKR